MKDIITEIQQFVIEILPEYSEISREIRIRNPRWSKKRIFETLFELGEKKYSPNNAIQDKEYVRSFTRFLSKANMEYSCFIAYAAGCVKSAYGTDHSGGEFFELIRPIAEIGKEKFGNST